MNTKLQDAQKSINKLRMSIDIGNPGRINEVGVLELEVVKGRSTAVRIYKKAEIVIMETCAVDGTIFAPHIHKDKREIVQVIKGCLKVWFNETLSDYKSRKPDKIVRKSNAIIFEPNAIHLVVIEGESEFIVSTMPPETNFP